MAVVRGVQVAVVNVVDVVAVRHGDMPATLAVGVFVGAVIGVICRLALVVVARVGAVQVAVVGVVDVVAMRHGDVPATLAVGVLVAGVFFMGGCHGALTSWRSR
jgi:hypothetical protein